MRVKIKNGLIVDGKFNPPFKGELVIEDTHICALGVHCDDLHCDEEFDAQENIIAPGFIDTHTHSDISSFTAPDFYGQLAQGVTSEVMGNCGLSPYPLTSKNRSHLEKMYAQYDVDLNWSDYFSYKSALNEQQMKINLFSLVGHNTLRAAVMGYEAAEPTDAQIQQMKLLLDQMLSQGALGVSLGLMYTPGVFASKDELIKVLEPVAKHSKILTTHLRSEGTELLESLDEVISIAQIVGIKRVHISHLKTALPSNWHKIDALLERLSTLHKGIILSADRYPYVESMTSLSIIAPAPYDKLNDSEIMQKLSQISAFAQCVKSLAERPASYWDTVRLVNTHVKQFQPYLGQFISVIATALKMDCPTLVTHLLAHDAVGTLAAFSGMNHDNMYRIVCAENVCCGSDEQTKPLDGSKGRSHPRLNGSMPLFFNYNRRIHSLEKTIGKMTSLPAKIFGLQHRGALEVGNIADIIVFSESEYQAQSTFESPYLLAKGVKAVWVKGKRSL